MRRRDFIIFLAGAMAGWPLAARAQQKSMPVIGFLHPASPAIAGSRLDAFRQGLREVGYIEGQNVRIEYHWAEDHAERLPALAADLAGRKVDVIAATGSSAAALAAKAGTSTIPIVFTYGGDPVRDGLVESLARPGGNATGSSILTTELNPKRLELLYELVPETKVIAFLVDPTPRGSASAVSDMQQAARAKGVQVHILKASTEGEIDAAFATLVETHTGVLIVAAQPFFNSRLSLWRWRRVTTCRQSTPCAKPPWPEA